MPDKNAIRHTQKLFAAFLFGLNIPGSRFVSGKQVQDMLRPLSPRIAFVRIVARPDSVLLRCDASITEQSLREALRIHLGCNSVVIIEYFEQALALSQKIGDVQGEGSDLGNLGIAYAKVGQCAKAMEFLEKSRVIFEDRLQIKFPFKAALDRLNNKPRDSC